MPKISMLVHQFMDDNFLQEYGRESCTKLPLIPVLSSSFHTPLASLRAVDYFSAELSEDQYFRCWISITNNRFMKPYELSNFHSVRAAKPDSLVEDLQVFLPCTSSARLENACWRAWQKSRNRLPELDPAEINWHKENDITALYGPVLECSLRPHLAEPSSDELSDDELFSCSSGSSLTSVSSLPTRGRQRICKRPKRVSFCDQIARRDIVGDAVFDCTYAMDTQ
ncbi:hypothetical protein KL925_001773 [Ogataea polymorpha]|nr:hypothetical protein KL936_001772 [Ogataea polymorpha]KAG7928473.1 hypothetical protein KL925_001773 [Ogataea polymorpha]